MTWSWLVHAFIKTFSWIALTGDCSSCRSSDLWRLELYQCPSYLGLRKFGAWLGTWWRSAVRPGAAAGARSRAGPVHRQTGAILEFCLVRYWRCLAFQSFFSVLVSRGSVLADREKKNNFLWTPKFCECTFCGKKRLNLKLRQTA